MATSGSKDYTITRARIIEGALRKLGTYDQAGGIPGDEVSAASESLNLMVKEWVARGIDIWLREEITLFLQPDVQSYAMGTAHATTSYVQSALTTAASGIVLELDTTGMTASDFIGVKLPDNTIQWGTIVTVDTATQATVSASVTANSGARVYVYTTKAGRPQKLVYALRRDSSDHDTEINIVGQKEYYRLSDKGSNGPPVECWYQPTLGTGTLYVWPVDGGSTFDKLVLIAQTLPDDLDTQANEPQFPIEWGNTLVWGLAAELASEYGIAEREQGRLWRIAEHKLEVLLAYDTENADVVFAMDYQR